MCGLWKATSEATRRTTSRLGLASAAASVLDRVRCHRPRPWSAGEAEIAAATSVRPCEALRRPRRRAAPTMAMAPLPATRLQQRGPAADQPGAVGRLSDAGRRPRRRSRPPSGRSRRPGAGRARATRAARPTCMAKIIGWILSTSVHGPPSSSTSRGEKPISARKIAVDLVDHLGEHRLGRPAVRGPCRPTASRGRRTPTPRRVLRRTATVPVSTPSSARSSAASARSRGGQLPRSRGDHRAVRRWAAVHGQGVRRRRPAASRAARRPASRPGRRVCARRPGLGRTPTAGTGVRRPRRPGPPAGPPPRLRGPAPARCGAMVPP